LRGTLKGVKANETFDQWTKAGNSFRGSLQKGWITGKVLTDTLSQFTGDLTDAQLKAQGYNKTQIAQIQELAKTASGAATHIKTLSQLQDALKEEVATAYGAIFKTIFGDINGATKLFSGIHTVVENALTVPIYALNTLLQKVSALGGRAKAIDAFKNAFHALSAVIKPIKDAFREIFPPATAKSITAMITRFDEFTKRLTVSAGTADKIKRTFAGLFAIFDIARQVVSGVVHAILDLFGAISTGAGSGLLNITANIGDMIVSFDKALKSGGALRDFFKNIGGILAVPLRMLGDFASALGSLFGGFHAGDARGVTSLLDRINTKLEAVRNSANGIGDWFSGLMTKIKPGLQAVVNAFSHLGEAIARGLNSQAFGNILKTVQVGLLGGLVLMIKKFFSKGINVDIGGGLFGKAGEVLEGVTKNLKAMQLQLKAKTLLEIASALGILVLSIVALSAVNPAKIADSLKAMAVGFGELLASFALLSKMSGAAGLVKMPVMAASLNLLATSIAILAGAVRLLAGLSWEELKKGLSAVGILLAEVSAAAMIISRNSGSMIAAGIGITAMAVALNILFLAVKEFSTLKWQELVHGLAGVGGALAAVALGIRLMPKGMVATGIGLLAIAAALNGIYLAVKQFSTLNWKDMAKGLAGVAGSLVAIALGMHLMPKGMLLQAAALAALAGSLILIEKVMVSMAKLSWGTIAHGLGAIAATLGILAIALNVMDGALPGAAALAIAAGSLRLLLPVVQGLGKQSWGEIAKGLLTLAGSLTILILAGAGAELVLPGLIALSVASLAIGAGMALAGVGVGALAAGLSLLAATGSAGIAVLIGAITAVIAKIPAIAVAFAQGIVDVLLIIGKNGPAIVTALGTIMASLLTVVIKNAPLLAHAFEVLIEQALAVIVKEAPKIIDAGFRILMDLLSGIQKNIGRITTTVANIIVNFLNALAKNMPRIINAGVNLLTRLLVGIASALGRMPGIAFQVVGAFISSLFHNNGRIVSAGISMLGRLVSGIASAIGRMASAAGSAIGHFVSGISKGAGSLVSAGSRMVGRLASGIASGIRQAASTAYNLAKDIGSSIVSGILDGVKGLASSLTSKLKGAVGGAIHSVGSVLHIGGPSMLFSDEVGKPIVWGISHGIDNNAKMITNSVKGVAKGTVAAFTESLAGLPDALGNMDQLTPTITPVLDLSSVQKDATKISGLVAPNALAVSTSFQSASAISADQQAATAATSATAAAAMPPVTVKFEQTNNSPKALSTTEIYRQTNNQLSQFKAALKIPIPQVPQ
jgi:phage-related protein